MANLKKEETDFILGELTNPNHRRVFHGLDNKDLEETLFIILKEKRVNGELTDALNDGAIATKALLTDWQKKLKVENEKKKVKDQEEEKQQQVEQEKLNQSILLLMLGALVRKFGGMYFKLLFKPDQTYAESLVMVKEHLNMLKAKFLLPMLTSHTVTDENKQNQIHKAAIMNLLLWMFSVPVFTMHESSTQLSAYALVAAMTYQGEINGYTLAADSEVSKILNKRREEILSSMANSIAAESGTPVDKVKPIIEKYLYTIIGKFQDALLN